VTADPDGLAVTAGTVAFPEVVAPPGGGLASAGLVSAPVPHGIASPVPGCLSSVGGVDSPAASASVNRVVHNVVLAPGLVNW